MILCVAPKIGQRAKTIQTSGFKSSRVQVRILGVLDAAAHTDALQWFMHARENAASAPCPVSGDTALGKHRKSRRPFLVTHDLLSRSSSLLWPIPWAEPVHSMSSESHPLSSLEQELVGLLDEHARLGSHADDISLRVCLARAWLKELEREFDQLNALTNPAPGQKRQLRLLRLDIDYCKEIISKYDDLVLLARAWLEELEHEFDRLNALANSAPEQKRRLLDIDHCKEIVSKHDALQRSCVCCMLVIPPDGAVFRVKSDEQRPKDVHIKKACFVGAAGQELVAGMRFAVPSKEHIVISERLECSALYPGCELPAVAPSALVPAAFVTVSKLQECADLAGHFDVLVTVERARLLPPAWVTCEKGENENEKNKKNFKSWQRLQPTSAECGGWSEAEMIKLSQAHNNER
jgi:hypothetical protein